MSCELNIPVSQYGLYPVTTDVGPMGVELSKRESTNAEPDPSAICVIKAAISAHFKGKNAVVKNYPNSFEMDTICKRCGDHVIFTAEEIR